MLKGLLNRKFIFNLKLAIFVLQNQHLELSKILKSKDNEIKNKCNEINSLHQENKDLNENLKVSFKYYTIDNY